ncbi:MULTISPECIES: Hsp20/alpha crystallin family protein [unclassified Amycolatopsis]|uniref:Hsp20/alpha crystallin family protein n=1 Tax=unclassified Amycolatopsis TaxID=2618356 RepID=UPI002E11D7B9|nr:MULTISPECIES: Hsp20/alpha crystallin family protein [unclassified Amycolatopsis]WSJ78877.1 Hsp20/alpha crystallin family protein [Amycolatopsis sp. NBC_01307]WSK77557.1 Hsp20/alpha crystallin family protein [Amycolatopsis sp. NBC_01286]
MTLMRFDPFRDLERLTEQAVAGTRGPRAMPMEAFRRGDRFVVALDLPGVDPGDVDLTVEHNVVTVRTRRTPLRREGDELLVDERPQGEFSRQFFLGDNLDSTRLSAEFDRGVLMLGIPVAEASKPRKVEIGTGSETAEEKPRIAEQVSREEHANV